MILDKLRKSTIGRSLKGRSAESDGLRQGIILSEDLNGMGAGGSEKTAPVNIRAHADFMCPEPLLLRELIIGKELKLFAAPGPLIEVIAAPALGRDEHIRGALTLSIAVKTSVLDDGRENGAGIEFVSIGQGSGHTALI